MTCETSKTERILRRSLIISLFAIFTVFFFPFYAFAQSSPNYQLQPVEVGGSGVQSGSATYETQGVIGPSSPSLGSPNYKLLIGTPLIPKTPAIPKKTTTEESPAGPQTVPKAIEKGIDTIIDNTKKLTEVPKKIAEIVKNLPPPLQETAKNLANAVNDTVSTLRGSNTVTNVVESIVKPITRTTAVVTAVAAGTAFSFEFSNLAYLLFRLGYFWFVPLSVKRRQPWGVVFDSVTGRPIKGTVVRIFSKEFNKLRETQVTDEEGRFGFFVDVGEYYIQAAKPGFVFPSRILTAQALSRHPNLYRGEILTVREKREGAIAVNIPVDTETVSYPRARLIRIRILNFIANLLDRLNNPLLIVGTVASWIMLIVNPTIVNYWVLGIYGFLLFVKLLISSRIRRSYGRVRDATTKKPVELALLRIYNATTNTIVSTRVTDREGQFTALVRSGDYYVMVTKNAYEAYRSPSVTVPKGKAVLRLDVDLKPLPAAKQPTFPPTPQPMRPARALP